MDHTTDFDPFDDGSLWSEILVFPHPARLSDDSMDYYFRRYDGKWSRQTKLAMEELGAKGLELNSNWALEDQSWSCRGCRRHKREIMRRSSNGILLAKLELHHDHLWDECFRRADEILGPEWRENMADGASILFDMLRSLAVRFDEALVCSECNAADGKAKLAVGADPNFTFAVSEIATFVKAAPHQDHEIDLAAAKTAWEAERPHFERRIAIFELLLKDIAAGHLQRRHEGRLRIDYRMFQRVGDNEMLSDAFRRAAKGTANAGLLGSMRSDFLARSVQKDVVRKPGPKKAMREPTDEEYQTYVPEKIAGKWAETGDDWACPCCGRGKRSLMRMSAKKKWTGNIRTVEQYDVLLDEDEVALRERLFPGFPNDIHLQERRLQDVCSDCADISTRLGQQRRDLADIYLTLEQMNSCLVVIAANVPHLIDLDMAAEMSRSNWRYRHAIQAVSAFIELRNAFRTKMEHAVKWNHRESTFLQLDGILEIDHRMDDPEQRKDVMKMFKDGDYSAVAIWLEREVENS